MRKMIVEVCCVSFGPVKFHARADEGIVKRGVGYREHESACGDSARSRALAGRPCAR